ncbi:hypothetical protein T07_795 [Trichinella nelsoni]|uniref:Uncharacterized protein n=1 Tax=Trichinella nelsoni TaxID=6336 RepID=A0A0V0RHM9_9BILA|nr:hypothetical protein T07_795 [Trichinella nelsoni]
MQYRLVRVHLSFCCSRPGPWTTNEQRQPFQPAGKLPLWFAEVPQPSQGVVVCEGYEPPAVQVRSEMVDSPDEGQLLRS